MITCPECGCEGEEEEFDCIGACNNNVFCHACHTEFDPDTGEAHYCDTTADQAALNRENGVWCQP